MKDQEAHRYIAIDESLLDDFRTVLDATREELAKCRSREALLALEVERNKPMTEEEACRYLGRDRESLRNYRLLGLDSFKKGGSRWYTKAIIDDWLATGRVNLHKKK